MPKSSGGKLPSKSAAPQPTKLRGRYEVAGDGLRIVYRGRNLFQMIFLSAWLIGWTVGCVALAIAVYHKFEWGMLLFGIPFWASWILVFGILVNSLVGCDELWVRSDGLSYCRWLVIPLWRREIPRGEIRDVSIAKRFVDKESGQQQEGIRIQTLGKPLELFFAMPHDELRWLAEQMRQILPVGAGNAGIDKTAVLAAPSEVEEDEEDEDETPVAERVIAAGPAPDAPSDCTWTVDRNFNALIFRQRGRLGLLGILGLLFVCAFWNGIVSVFLLALFGQFGKAPEGLEWWGILIFLIPFEAVGLALISGLVAALAEPLRRTRWTFGPNAIAWQSTWLGMGPRQEYRFTAPGHIAIERKELAVRMRRPQASPWTSDACGYELALVDREDRLLCRFGNLTEGEARWIAGQVIEAFPEWGGRKE